MCACMVSDDEGPFTVKGLNSHNHCLSFGTSSIDTTPSCTCCDWVQRNIPCKHFWEVFWSYPTWNWGKFLEGYQRCAYLSTYTGALDTFFKDSPANLIDDLQDGAHNNTIPCRRGSHQHCCFTRDSSSGGTNKARLLSYPLLYVNVKVNKKTSKVSVLQSERYSNHSQQTLTKMLYVALKYSNYMHCVLTLVCYIKYSVFFTEHPIQSGNV